jgi:L-amino acid N-acyltransferase YncA
MPEALRVRKAADEDAEGIVNVMGEVASERALGNRPCLTIEEQRRYLRSLSDRESVHVAIADSGPVVGCQSLDMYSPILSSMAHVAQIGTFILPAWRRRGVGQALFDVTLRFALSAGYRKLVITVRASNASALSFYQSLGFVECGRLSRQVEIDGKEDDEIILELFLDRRV